MSLWAKSAFSAFSHRLDPYSLSLRRAESSMPPATCGNMVNTLVCGQHEASALGGQSTYIRSRTAS